MRGESSVQVDLREAVESRVQLGMDRTRHLQGINGGDHVASDQIRVDELGDAILLLCDGVHLDRAGTRHGMTGTTAFGVEEGFAGGRGLVAEPSEPRLRSPSLQSSLATSARPTQGPLGIPGTDPRRRQGWWDQVAAFAGS